mgnify:CR=1 FL=1
MRTNIAIDDVLMIEAKKVSGLKTKREIVEEGLRLLLHVNAQRTLIQHKGQYHIEKDLHESRIGRGK